MKNFIVIFILLTLFSCKTDKIQDNGSIDFKIWEITNYSINEQDLMGKVIKKGYVISNLKNNRTFIQLSLSEISTKELEEKWKSKYKKLELIELQQIQEISYNQDGSKLTISDKKLDYVLKGNKTDKLLQDINNKLQSDRRGETSGAIPLLYRLWVPHFMNYIPLPMFKSSETFSIKKDENIISLTNEDTTIILADSGSHQWIGY